MTKGEEERVKITATWLNNVSVATTAIGVVTPIVSPLNHLSLYVILALASALALHMAARYLLGRLDK